MTFMSGSVILCMSMVAPLATIRRTTAIKWNSASSGDFDSGTLPRRLVNKTINRWRGMPGFFFEFLPFSSRNECEAHQMALDCPVFPFFCQSGDHGTLPIVAGHISERTNGRRPSRSNRFRLASDFRTGLPSLQSADGLTGSQERLTGPRIRSTCRQIASGFRL